MAKSQQVLGGQDARLSDVIEDGLMCAIDDLQAERSGTVVGFKSDRPVRRADAQDRDAVGAVEMLVDQFLLDSRLPVVLMTFPQRKARNRHDDGRCTDQQQALGAAPGTETHDDHDKGYPKEESSRGVLFVVKRQMIKHYHPTSRF